MRLFDNAWQKSVPHELDFSPRVLILVFIPTVGILLTFEFGAKEATFVQDSVAVAVSFSFVSMTVLGEKW